MPDKKMKPPINIEDLDFSEGDIDLTYSPFPEKDLDLTDEEFPKSKRRYSDSE